MDTFFNKQDEEEQSATVEAKKKPGLFDMSEPVGPRSCRVKKVNYCDEPKSRRRNYYDSDNER